MQGFAAGLQALEFRVDPADAVPPRIALFSDNCPRWLIADQGILRSGAANVVRGAQADPLELRYILEHSGAIGVVVQDLELLNKLRSTLDEVPIETNTAGIDRDLAIEFSEPVTIASGSRLVATIAD